MIARTPASSDVPASVVLTRLSESPVTPAHDFLSPSLVATPQSGLLRELPPAYEVKFLLTELEARQVESDLRPAMFADPHANSGRDDGAYTTTTLYCDTAEFDIYHRRGSFARRKFRIRRYGLENLCFLECKTKQGTRVQKRRSPVSLDVLGCLGDAPIENCWEGDWFHRRIAVRQLRPVVTVIYDRTAYFSPSDEGTLRLTFDRNIRGMAATGWQVAPFSGGSSVLRDRVVCEFKFRGMMPTLFKQVLESRRLSPGSASKYRLCLEAAGIVDLSGSPHA